MTPSARDLAQRFHEAYERLAPSFGYETRVDTHVFDADGPNGKLMIAVCDEVMTAALAQARADEREACANEVHALLGDEGAQVIDAIRARAADH